MEFLYFIHESPHSLGSALWVSICRHAGVGKVEELLSTSPLTDSGKHCAVLEVADTVELGSRDLIAPPSFVLLVKWANFLQLSSTSHQQDYLEQTLWSASALMIFNHTTGHAQPQRQGANRSPTSPDQT